MGVCGSGIGRVVTISSRPKQLYSLVCIYCAWLLLFAEMREISNIDLLFGFRFTG